MAPVLFLMLQLQVQNTFLKKVSSPHSSGAKVENTSFYETKSMRQLAFRSALQIFFYNLVFLEGLIHYISDLS